MNDMIDALDLSRVEQRVKSDIGASAMELFITPHQCLALVLCGTRCQFVEDFTRCQFVDDAT